MRFFSGRGVFCGGFFAFYCQFYQWWNSIYVPKKGQFFVFVCFLGPHSLSRHGFFFYYYYSAWGSLCFLDLWPQALCLLQKLLNHCIFAEYLSHSISSSRKLTELNSELSHTQVHGSFLRTPQKKINCFLFHFIYSAVLTCPLKFSEFPEIQSGSSPNLGVLFLICNFLPLVFYLLYLF